MDSLIPDQFPEKRMFMQHIDSQIAASQHIDKSAVKFYIREETEQKNTLQDH